MNIWIQYLLSIAAVSLAAVSLAAANSAVSACVNTTESSAYVSNKQAQ